MQLRRSMLDWTLEALALAALIVMAVIVIDHWNKLPRFPLRFGARGNPWNGASTLMLLVMNAVLYLALTAAARYQHWINLPFEIDRQRIEVRQILLSMTIAMKTVLMILLAGLLWIAVS